MKKYCLVVCYLIVAFASFGQAGKLKKADAYYEKLSYSYAVDLYEELIGSEVDSPKLQAKIGSCYYYMGNMVKFVDRLEFSKANFSVSKGDKFK